MKTITYSLFLLLTICSCEGNSIDVKYKEPKKVAQWLNPLYYNNDFETELNFPIWFNDSFVKSHEIYKITKRVFAKIVGDTSEINSYKEALPKEKTEYFFDPNGKIEKIIVSSYFDDRQISKATFEYEGNRLKNSYQKVKSLPFISLTKNPIKDEFTTDFYADKTHQFSLYLQLVKKPKYYSYIDIEKGNKLFVIPNKKYWGPLSIDSIIKPAKEDWIILGSIKKPIKRYKVENIVKESLIYNYFYYKSGALKSRIKKVYPFEYKRNYLYNSKNIWNAYIDSTFTEGKFISKMENKIIFDQYQRPIEINHFRMEEDIIGFYYKESFHYRTHKK